MKETDAARSQKPPIFCEQCPNLALALVEESPLCRRCLAAVASGRTTDWIHRNARPLDIKVQKASPVQRARPGRSDDPGSEKEA
jgi:hypothetical protein